MSLTTEQFIAIASHNYPGRFSYNETKYAGADEIVIVQDQNTHDYLKFIAGDLLTKPAAKTWESKITLKPEY